jgi:phosphatidylglycerophosphate synthase
LKAESKYTGFIDAVMAVLFGVFAVLQLNDPDPALWFGLYALASMVSLSLIFLKNTMVVQQTLARGRWVLLFFMISIGLYFWPWSEEQWREVGGTLLLTLWAWLRHVPATQKAAFEP